jgi:hypothetical protein
MGTAIHLHLAKRMLKFYPLLLNDIYLSDEYYGENVLHMSCVAEDPSVVKWLLDIGADINRWAIRNEVRCLYQRRGQTKCRIHHWNFVTFFAIHMEIKQGEVKTYHSNGQLYHITVECNGQST